MAAATNKDSGALFEGLISNEADKKNLLSVFATYNIQIVSPTVQGLLSGFGFESDPLGISGCDIDYISDVNSSLPGLTSNNKDDKESESANHQDFLGSLSSFVNRVKDIRSSFLPYELYNGLITNPGGSNNISEIESYENAFMRMLGMPDDKDVGTSTGASGSDVYDPTKKIIYGNPIGGIKTSVAMLSEIIGEISPISDQYANIIAERQKLPTGGRFFDFSNVTLTEQQKEEFITALAASYTGTEAPSNFLNYYNKDDLFKFYYLKTVPMQSSKIYGCVSEPQKIVSKPFDPDYYSTINGIKPKTSLLETIIRIRLDKVTGSPGIYSTKEEENNKTGISIGRVKAENLGEDGITQVECFIIQKLKRVMFELAKKYKEDAKNNVEREIKANINPKDPPPDTGNSSNSADKGLYDSELSRLEVLKAKEDAILFLLKDTSSSYNTDHSSSLYSSLDIQEGIIRTSSGFDDVLSAPLYSVLSQRSEYLDKKIKQLREQIDLMNRDTGDDTKRSPTIDSNNNNGDLKTYSYIGVCSEDLIVYTMALLSLNQDFLIGLLPQKNRIYLSNVISNSILTSKKDPYGIIDRVNKEPSKGGFPSVVDSVNALSLLVLKYYSIYIDFMSNNAIMNVYESIRQEHQTQATNS
jgi:hypothetical protein